MVKISATLILQARMIDTFQCARQNGPENGRYINLSLNFLSYYQTALKPAIIRRFLIG